MVVRQVAGKAGKRHGPLASLLPSPCATVRPVLALRSSFFQCGCRVLIANPPWAVKMIANPPLHWFYDVTSHPMDITSAWRMPSSRQKFKLRHQPHSFSIPPPQASCLPHPSSCSILGLAPESPRIGPNRHQCSQGVCGESPPACSGLEHSVARPATRPPKFTPPK